MGPLDLAGWAAAAVILGSYAVSIVVERPRVFHYGNLLGSLALMPVNIALGLWYSVTLGVCFTILSTIALIRRPYEQGHR